MLRSRVGPAEIDDWIRKFTAFLLIELTNFQKDAREYFLIDFSLTRRRQGHVFPLQPARGVDERAILLGKSRARQTIDSRINVFHLVCRSAGSFPEFGCLFRIEVTHNEEVSFLQCLDVLARVRTDSDAVHAKRKQA